MEAYRLKVLSVNGLSKTAIVRAESPDLAISSFRSIHPTWIVESYEVILPVVNNKSKNHRSPAVMRNTYKARMVQVRNNLQSMIEDESSLLTEEEIIQLSRITCKLGHVISMFHTRSMDMKREGKI